MILFVLGLVLFLGIHSVRIVADDWRTAMIARMGAGAWKGLYTIVSIVGFVLLVYGFSIARWDAPVLWVRPDWAPHVTALFMLASMILLAGFHFKRSHLSVAVRHPMVWSVVLLGAGHLLSRGTLVDLLLFGGLFVWGVADLASCYARDRRNRTIYPQPVLRATLANLVLGIVLFVVIGFWLHQKVIGLAPIG